MNASFSSGALVSPGENRWFFFPACFLGALAVILPVMAFNFVMDPGGVFRGDHLAQEVVSAMREGVPIRLREMDERLVHRLLVEGFSRAPETIVLGSSRGLLIQSKDVGAASFFNHSMTNAALDDLVGLVGVYHRRGFFPRQVIWGVDPWLFNKGNREICSESLHDDAVQLAKVLGLPPDLRPGARRARTVLEKIQYLLASNTSEESYLLWKRARREGGTRGAVRSSVERVSWGDFAEDTRLPDGSVVYGEMKQGYSQEKVRSLAQDLIQREGGIRFLGNFERLDPLLMRAAEALGRYLKTRGAQVTLVLTPYHPMVHQEFERQARYAQVKEAERFVRQWAAREGWEVLGSYDPARAGCSEDEFYDGLHARPSCLERILHGLRKDNGGS